MNFKQNAEKLLITCASRRNVRSQSHTLTLRFQSLHDLGRAAAVLRWLTSDQSDHQPPGLAAGVHTRQRASITAAEAVVPDVSWVCW